MGQQSMILVVDDLPMFRELEARFLASSGTVITARTGAEALELARRQRPEVLVAAFDLSDVEGDALCKEIRSDPQLCDLPVVLVIGDDDGEIRARAVRAGADDVVSKPLERISLISAVSRFLRIPIARALVRAPLDVPVRIRLAGDAFEARVRNISRGGIYVESEQRMETGAEMTLEFSLPEAEAPVTTTARVMWRSDAGDVPGDGVGLQFLRIDGADARRVEQYVAAHAPRDPS